MSISINPVEEVLGALEAGGFDPRPSGPDEWASRCPVHQGTKHNLTVSRGESGNVLLHCHHIDNCGFQDILSALGIMSSRSTYRFVSSNAPMIAPAPKKPKPKKIHATAKAAISAARWIHKPNGVSNWDPESVKIVAGWKYEDATGEVALVVARFKLPDGSKGYSQAHRVEGGWVVGTPQGPRPLYNLPAVLESDRVYLVEGEKAADVLTGIGLVATTTLGGAGSPHKADLSPLQGRDVVILPDNDDEGRRYVDRLVELLTTAGAKSVRVVNLPGLPAKGDVAEWLDSLPDSWEPATCVAELERLVELATPTPRQRVDEARREIETPDEVEIDPPDDAVLAGLPRTDLGNAERLVARFGRDIRYCHAWSQWLVWDGSRWVVDRDGAINRRAKSTVRDILRESATLGDSDARKAHAAFAFKSESNAAINAMISIARSEDGVPVSHEDLDQDPWLFNCPNGTIDLRSGQLHPHRRTDLMSMMSPTEFDPRAKCPLWESTLRLVFGGDDELIAYFQRLCGYFLTGVVRDHILPILHGHGSNGKSTILETLMGVWGPGYAMKAPSSLLMSKFHETHPTEKADLFRKRLVAASETDQGRRLDEALVKELCDGDTVRARRMREDFWEFSPTHKLALCTNHVPSVRGTDNGIWRRLRLVPFNVTIEVADKSVPDRLKAEHPGILAWAVQGCLAWQRDGLEEPECVRSATQDYREGQDVIGTFLRECTAQEDSLRVKSSALFDAYRKWAEAGAEHVTSNRQFTQAMKERGFAVKRSGGSWFCGIGLCHSGNDDSRF